MIDVGIWHSDYHSQSSHASIPNEVSVARKHIAADHIGQSGLTRVGCSLASDRLHLGYA